MMKRHTARLRQLRQALVAIVLMVLTATATHAQTDGNIHINVLPKSDILPPQVGQYKDNVGKLFMVTVTNNGAEEQYVYFGMQLEYLTDAQGIPVANLKVSTPVDRLTAAPWVIPPGSNTLSEIDLRRLFNHIPTSALQFDADLIGNVGTSDFALLPEGRYRARLTAYKWDITLVDQATNRVTNPIPLTDPTIEGSCEFEVCYRAQAPQLQSPSMAFGMVGEAMGTTVAKLPADNPVFTWSEPIINCNTMQQWRYELIIKELLDNGTTLTMSPQEAIDAPGHPYAIRVPAITQPQYMLNLAMLNRLKEGKVYVAQVTATPIGGSTNPADFNYSLIENNGKSNFIAFTIDKSNGLVQPTIDDDKPLDGDDSFIEDGNDSEDEEDIEEEDEEEDDLDLELIGVDYEINEGDAKYVMRNPKIVAPDFTGDPNRSVLAGNTVESKWEIPTYVGGEGQQPDTLKFRYRAQIYGLDGYANIAEALEHKPIYDAYVKGPMPKTDTGKTDDGKTDDGKTDTGKTDTGKTDDGKTDTGKTDDGKTTEGAKPLPKVGELPEDDKKTAVGVLEDYILWKDVAEHVSVGDALLLRILPECINEESVRFFDDEINTVAFTYSDKMSEVFGNACREGVLEENRKPIELADAEMVGKTVYIGEYAMVVKEAQQDKDKHTWSGKGWVNWYPLGKDSQKVKIGAEFKGIYINSDYIVYDGVVTTEKKSNWEHLKDRAKDFSDPSATEDLIPDDIFTEWGLDNLLSSCTPDALQDYVDADAAGEEVNNLAKKVKASKYYDYVQRGYAVYDKLMNGDISTPEIEVFLPLQIPESWNPSPVDIQVVSCEWHPTVAYMNLIGMATLPDNDITDENILMFGAPRICMDPDQMLPGSGNIILLENLTLNDPKSDFSIKFKAPKNKEKPDDGCMIRWADNKLQMLAVDCEIAIPDLIKCDETTGKPLEGQVPKMQFKAEIQDWEDWISTVSIDPFCHEDLPGWTFRAKDVTLDLSAKKNREGMTFPAGFKKDHFITPDTKTGNNAWKGLYIGEISVEMPEGFLKNGDSRFKITGSDMLFDKSGVTCSIGMKEPVNASIDDWALRIKEVSLNIMQNDFDGCGMKGDIHVPLTDKEDYIAFSCDMIPQKKSLKKSASTTSGTADASDKKGGFDFLLKIQPTEDGKNELDGKLKFDFFLATLKLTNKQTYFLLEAIDQGEDKGYDTKVELCMAGEINIGGKNLNMKEQLDDLPFKIDLPGIHFTQMRISNRKREEQWVHGQAIRSAAQEEYEKHKDDFGIPIAKNKTYEFGTEQSPCYLDCGNWSVASFDKRIGPFAFGIDDYDFSRAGETDSVYLEVKGHIGLVMNGENSLVSATTTLRFNALVNVEEKEFTYAGTDFRGCSLDVETMGMKIFGELNVNDGKAGSGKNGVTDKGYDGTLKFTMPGDFFTIEAEGGYYEHKAEEGSTTDESYAWGYFRAALESKAGIHADPVVINRIMGGFYFNCQPTKGTDEKKDPFGGKPQGKKGPIGIALGLGLSTSAGEETLKADVDLLVVYDRKYKRLSTFMMNGSLEAISGMIKAKVSLIYEHTSDKPEADKGAESDNDKSAEAAEVAKTTPTEEKTKDKYLTLNITVDVGADTKSLMEKVTGGKDKLESIQKSLNEFQENLDKIELQALVSDPTSTLDGLAGKDDETGETDKKSDDKDGKDKDGKDKDGGDKDKKKGIEAGKTHISLEFKITWYKNFEKVDKWHLYVGQPAKDKRCSFTYLKFDSKVCSVDIGADGYLCIGNELPDNGALPDIPDKIRKFLDGEKKEGVDMGADMAKVEKSRAKVTREILKPGNMKGGVMVGASVWGNISIDLGLITGGLESEAGFDLSLINYGTTAVCINSGSAMGYHGWYALGQLYAYLGADLGVRIKIGKLINKKVTMLKAGIGGLLEMGLPHPNWVEGKIRVKMSFLGGLFKLNKKFSFSAGDHCVPFVGNALADFDMFKDVSLGSDSIYEALCNPATAISKSDAHRMIFTTNTSLGSHYRLVDPSYQAYTGNDSLLSIHNSRTYVFDVEKDPEWYLPKGVELYDLGTLPTQLVNSSTKRLPSESEFRKKLQNAIDAKYDNGKTQESLLRLLGNSYYDRQSTSMEASTVMKNKSLESGSVRMLSGAEPSFANSGCRVDGISFREDKGTSFHLTGMNLQAGHSYMLVLRGSAYEILNGRRQWVEYYDENKNNERVHIKWNQTRLWFFRVKSDAEDRVEGDSLKDLTPYVALAYPSVDGTNVQSKGITTTAYINDILKPTVALNRDLRNELPEGTMEWVLDYYKSSNLDKPKYTATRKAFYNVSGNCYNIEPKEKFNRLSEFVNAHTAAGSGYNFNDETYRMRLNHTFKYQGKDSTVALVDLWLNPAPYDVVIKGSKYSDNWMQTTAHSVTGSLLPYSEPFVGARPWEKPHIDYEDYYRGRLSNKINDDVTFINNAEKYEGKPYRLVDPYLYLAYLSKWTFIGDRAINAYAFDEVKTPLGSETLFFQKGGTVMNAEFLKNDKDVKSLYQVRNDFYSTWNDWSYNNADLPTYPLPITLGSLGGPTLNNQDDRASTITPINLNYGESKTYKLSNLVKDFSDPYVVASQMSQKLRREAQNLFGIFTLYLKKDDNDKITGLNNSAFNYYMKLNSDLHRGQYIEVTSGDVSAKVPYYQLPLIFGDCFGGDAKYKGVSLDNDGRTFSKSIGKNDITDTENRWPSEASNLLFFRLLGNENYTSCEPESFLRWSTKWSESYPYDNSSPDRLQVAWDFFDANEGLKAVTDFQARIYRVDAYDTKTGLYVISNPTDNKSGMGGGPWFETISINSTNADVKNLGEMTEGIAANEQYAATHYEHPELQALYTPFNQRLTLIYSDSVYVAGNKLGGNTIGEVWAGSEFDSKMKYSANVKKQLKSVQIDPSMANAEILSTANWFMNCENLEQIIGLRNLNTSKVKSMMGMFDTCSKLKSIDISMFDMSSVEIVHSLFYGCTALNSVKMNLDMPKLTDVTDMFAGCTSLETIDISTLKGANVRNMSYMFSTCTSLKTLRIDKFAPKEVDNATNVFYKIGDKSKGLTIYYSYYLPVKSQLPSWATLIELGNPAKAMHLQNSEGEQILLFINTDDDYAKNATVNIKGEGKTYSRMTVKNVWTADKVLNTGNTPSWNSIKSSLVRVIIDPSFRDAPKSMKNWFSNCTSLTAIEGLKNLSITYEASLEYMFQNCAKLKTVDVSGIDFSRVKSAAHMFSGCTSLTTITGLSGIELPRNIAGMFKNCKQIQLDMSSLNLKYVENAHELFYGCTQLTSVKLNLVLTDIKNIGGMFRGCSNLEEANLILHSGLTDISYLFEGCAKLKEIDFSRLHTDDVANMSYTFSGCSSLQKLWLNQLTAEKCTDDGMKKMFFNVPTDCHIYMLRSTYDDHQGIKGQLPTAQYKNLHLISNDVLALTLKKADKDYKLVFLKKQDNVSYSGNNVKYKGMEVVSVRESSDFIYNNYLYASPTCCEDYVTEVEFDPSIAEVSPTSTYRWLSNMPKLTTVSGLQYLNTSETTDMGYMFSGCTSLTSISGLNISESVTRLSGLFYNCKKLKSITFGTVNTSEVTDMSSMFSGCAALEELSLEKFSSASLRDMQSTFNGCTSLRLLTLGSSFTAAQVEAFDAKNTFSSVRDLLVDLPSANIGSVRTSFVDKLGFVEGKTGWIGRASMAEAQKAPQVIWTAANSTLTFYYGTPREVGEDFGRAKITQVWSGDDVANTPENNAAPWTSTLLMAGTDVKVVIDESFAQARPKSTNYWFALYRIESIEGFKNLNTSSAKNMNGMFKGSNVKELDLSNIYFRSAVKADEMFADCKELHTLMDLRSEAMFNTTAENMFRNVSDVDVVLNQQWMLSTVKPNWESKVGWIEGTHGRFLWKNDHKVMQAIWTEANKTMTFVYKAPYNAGDKFNGQTITNVWKGDDFALVEQTYSSNTKLLNGEWTSYKFYHKKWMGTVKNSLSKVVFDRSFADARPTNMKAWFCGFLNLTTIEGLDNLNTDEVTDMSWMFFNCTKLADIDLSRFNTSKVTTMESMFRNCSALTSLDLSSFNTEGVTDMNNMFRDCKGLTTITGSQVSFKKVTNMAFMFYNCPKLNLSMSLNGFILSNTDNVTSMAWMFAGNEGSTIYIGGLKTGNVKSMQGMFYGCKNITKLSWSSLTNYWKTDKVTDMSYMFAGCSKLNLNDVTAWSKYNTANVTTMKAMFKGCAAMTYLKLTPFNTAKVKNMESMFSGCKSLKTLIVGSGFSAVSLVGNQSDVFTGVTGLTINMPSSVYENRSTIFTTKLGFKSTNGSMKEN